MLKKYCNVIPTDNTDLYMKYKSVVEMTVRRYNRVSRHHDDIVQHVWLKLIEVGIINKYLASGSLPERLTVSQIAYYLTCSENYVAHLIAQHHLKHPETLLPDLQGNYLFSEVDQYLIEDQHDPSRSLRDNLKTKRCSFRSYLCCSVHNIWSNWCRSQSRRAPEIFCSPMDDGTPWEDMFHNPYGPKQIESYVETKKWIEIH